jgi:hypothetical protein
MEGDLCTEKPAGKRPLKRPGHRWVDNIKINLKSIGYESVDLMDLAQDRDKLGTFVNAVMNLRVSKNAGNFLSS